MICRNQRRRLFAVTVALALMGSGCAAESTTSGGTQRESSSQVESDDDLVSACVKGAGSESYRDDCESLLPVMRR